MDGGTQARAKLDEDTIAEYTALYVNSVALPPVECVRDEAGDRWLTDGFHRVLAAQRAGQVTIPACTFKGTQRDAQLRAAAANANHGLRRTNADKRRAVEMLLRDAEWSKWSDRKIGEAAGVHHGTVAAVRAELAISPRATAAEKMRPKTNSSQPTAGQDGAGNPVAPDPAVGPIAHGESGEIATPPIEMLGLAASDAWLASVRLVAGRLAATDQLLRGMQGDARLLPQPHQQRLYAALHEAAALARALKPAVVCAICRDPDGTKGKRKSCLSCVGLGWLTEEGRKGLHPSALETPRAAPARAKALNIQVERGGDFEPFDDTEAP
jgi:hypothetical protein